MNPTTTTASPQNDPRTFVREGASTAKQLMGHPVVALSNGERVGAIHDVVYSPAQGRLIGFTVTHGGGLFSRGETLWLAAEAIHAIGEDAVVVEAPTQLIKYEADSQSVEEIGESVLGKRLMTETGKFLGNVDDVFIDRQSRRVSAYEVSGGVWQNMMKGQSAVPVQEIVSIGHDVVVVPDFVQEHVEAVTGGLAGAYEVGKEKVAQARTEISETVEQKEADFALGKTSANTVTDDKGNLIVRQGEAITAEHIARAQALGQMHALALAAGKTQAGQSYDSLKERAAGAVDAARDKAADLGEGAQNKQGDLLVGKTTGRAVIAENGAVLVPAQHIITQADVVTVRNAGKLNDLSAAVGTQAFEAFKDRVGDAFDATKERLAAANSPAAQTAGASVTIITSQPVVVEGTASGGARIVEAPDTSAAATPASSVTTTPVRPASTTTNTTDRGT